MKLIKWFNDLKIAQKLMIGFAFVTAIAVIVGIIGYKGLLMVRAGAVELSGVRLPSVDALEAMQIAQTAILASERGLTNRRITDPQSRKEFYNEINAALKEAEQHWKEYEPLPHTAEESAVWQRFTREWRQWKQDHQQMMKYSLEKDQLIANGVDLASPEVESLDNRMFNANLVSYESYKVAHQDLDKLIDINLRVAAAADRKAAADMDAATIMLLLTVILGIIIAVCFAIFISNQISKPLTRGVAMMQEISKGHLGQRLHIDTQDELGILARTMDQFADYLQTIVVGTMQRIAVGDVSAMIESQDAQDEVGPALQQTIDSLRRMIAEMKTLSSEATAGNLDTRGDAKQYQGAYREIVEGVNLTLDAIIAPINETSAILQELAAGNLNLEVSGAYQGGHALLAEAVNHTIKSFNEVLTEFRNASVQVATGAQNLSESSQVLSQSATEQAATIEEITASVTEIAAQTSQNAENAAQANQLALAAREEANAGNEQMQKMLNAMTTINDSSASISKIIKVIDEIAFQTNILALNAAVEAARAGQYGKGFAVVAEEVRNLAARSAAAAKETTALIESSVHKVTAGTNIANETAESLDRIVAGIAKTTTLVGDIALASNEQASGLTQVNQGIGQIAQVTQGNTATAEQSAAASEELAGQAETLQDMLQRFKLKGSGDDRNVSVDTHNTGRQYGLKLLVNGKPKEKAPEEYPSIDKQLRMNSLEFGKY